MPFVAGVVLVTAWLHRRLGTLSGVLFLFLATVSPLLLDITRQARGYGLAFLAMSVLVVAALEATRTGSTWAVVAMCVSGGRRHVDTASVRDRLRSDRGCRSDGPARPRRLRSASVVSIAAIVAWYAPHSGNVQRAAQIPDGVQIGFPWV